MELRGDIVSTPLAPWKLPAVEMHLRMAHSDAKTLSHVPSVMSPNLLTALRVFLSAFL